MTSQTLDDLRRIEDIIGQRIYELTQGNPSGMHREALKDVPSLGERLSLGVLHWFVRFLLK